MRHRQFYTRVWLPTMRELGLTDPRPSIHELRHAHAAVLVSRGVPMMAVKERLGHESIATTDKLYAFLQPGVDEVVLGALDAAFSPGRSGRLDPQPSYGPAESARNSL